MPVGSGDTMTDRTVELGRVLQARGVNVSLSEIIDATRCTTFVDLTSRPELREALRATLVKDARHHPVFDAAFDRCFPARPPRAVGQSDVGDPTGDLIEALASGDALAAMAATLVDAHGGLGGELRGEQHHVRRVYLGADIARLMSRVRIADPELSPAMIRARVDELKRLIADDIRSHLDLDQGAAIDPDLHDVEFLDASRAELDQMRDVIRPIARKLAARLARRRRFRAGHVNLRRTFRSSLSSGGVPLDVAHDRPRAHRPELFVLCDISGSVADVSLFTLTLMSALSAELARTRSFVFVDAIDEITSLLDTTGHAIEPWQIMRNTKVIGRDGHSDYGAVFEQFWHEYGDRELRRTSTVIITGDARTNHRPSGDQWLAKIAERTRRVYWLNPEPASEWDTHDSAMAAYSPQCSSTMEVRNLRQLVAAVEQFF